MKGFRVLIVDSDGPTPRNWAEHLEDQGFEVRVCRSTEDPRPICQEMQPDFVVIDLIAAQCGGFAFLKWSRSLPPSEYVWQTLVCSRHNSRYNVEQALKSGAVDYLVKPFDPGLLSERLLFHVRKQEAPVLRLVHSQSENSPEAKGPHQNTETHQSASSIKVLQLMELVLKQAAQPIKRDEIAFQITRMLSSKLNGVRCSLIRTEDWWNAEVIVSSDDPTFRFRPLDLEKYPEVRHVVRSGETLVLEGLSEKASWAKIASKIRSIRFEALVVIPVFALDGHAYGVLSLRLGPDHPELDHQEIQFLTLVSRVLTLALNRRDSATSA